MEKGKYQGTFCYLYFIPFHEFQFVYKLRSKYSLNLPPLGIYY